MGVFLVLIAEILIAVYVHTIVFVHDIASLCIIVVSFFGNFCAGR